MRILLVEDDPVQASIFSGVIRKAGHDVDCAASKHTAIGLLESRAYDAAAIDLVLVISTGDTVAERAYWKGLGVVIMSATGRTTMDDMKATLELRGCKVHVALPKPFTPAVLLVALEEAARLAKAEDPLRKSMSVEDVIGEGGR
jgi:DNA-binding response OmpR family regulator